MKLAATDIDTGDHHPIPHRHATGTADTRTGVPPQRSRPGRLAVSLRWPRRSTTRTAPAAFNGPRRRQGWRSAQILTTGLILVLLFVPVIYLFGQLWSSTGRAVGIAATERAAVAYARPLNKLLAALVDARYAAARERAVDGSGVRAGADEVDGVDAGFADLLLIRERWTRLNHEINSTLAQNASGSDALRAYAAPIALTQALLGRIADSSNVTRDPGWGSYHLIDVALHRLPDVVVSASEMGVLAYTAAETPAATNRAAAGILPARRSAIAEDRLALAADGVDIALRNGIDPTGNAVVDLRLLGPMDEFAAATDELSQAAAALDVPRGGASGRVDAAGVRVKAAALALGAAVLDTVDTQLTENAEAYAGQRRILVLAGAAIALAAGAVLWLALRVPGPSRGSRASRAEGVDRPGYPVGGDDVGPDHSARIPNLVDARELLAPGTRADGQRGPSQEVISSK